ncbi:MAG: hypothetical protein FJX35_28090 [Alphaproteobacteria bacterium]|nr:hypothetical protein [Alphaproteobacteria bacterium]
MTMLVVIPVISDALVEKRLLTPLAGRSSLERTLAAAVGELPDARVVVTTDDGRVKAAVRAFGRGVVVHDRTVHDYVPALSAAVEATGDGEDTIVVLEPTHPFRPAGLVGRTAINLKQREHLDSVVSVRRFKANLWQIEDDGTIGALAGGSESRDRVYYQELIGLALATRPRLLRSNLRLGDAVGFEVVDQFWGLVDIRDDASLAVAQAIAEKMESIEESVE